MNFYDYDVWLRLFFNQIQTQHVSSIPEPIWHYERQPTEWHIRVKEEYRELFPYEFLFVFDPYNHIVTVNPMEWNEKSIRMFLHIHAELLRFLTKHHLFCFVRTTVESLSKHVYKNESIPLIPVGEHPNQLYSLIEHMREVCKESALFFTPAFGLFFHASLFPTFLWRLRFDIGGVLYINDTPCRTKSDLISYLSSIQHVIQHMEKKEQEIIAYASQWHKQNYYDPFTRTLVFFQKHLSFSCTAQLHPLTFEVEAYTLQFGSYIKKGSDLNLLVEQIKEKIKHHYYQDRLHAVIEKRM